MNKISYSEIATWNACRQKWLWNYVRRIVPKREARPLTFGSAGHYALAAAFRDENWEKCLDQWADERISEAYLFDEEIDELLNLVKDVKNVVRNFLEKDLGFNKVIAIEQSFEVSLPGNRTRLIGYWDMVVEDAQGHKWLVEHKFPKQFRNEDQLLLNSQIGIYQYAAQKLGHKIVGTIYNQILAKPRSVPTLNKNGTMSRALIKTDWATYRQALLDNGLNPKDYEEMEQKLAENEFFRRTLIYRSKAETMTFVYQINGAVWDIRRKKKHIYKNDSLFTCVGCPYKELCVGELKGHDTEFLIETLYEPKKERPEELSSEQEE